MPFTNSQNYAMKKERAMVRMIVIFWNYYFGSLDALFAQVCVAGVY
jgi:hypothetical protein